MSGVLTPPRDAVLSGMNRLRAFDLLRNALCSLDITANETYVRREIANDLGLTDADLRGVVRQIARSGAQAAESSSARGWGAGGARLALDDLHPFRASTALSVVRTFSGTVRSTAEDRLALDIGQSEIGRTEQVFLADTLAVAVRSSIFDKRFLAAEAESVVDSLSGLAEAMYGEPLAVVESDVWADGCPLDVADLLALPAGSPVLCQRQRLRGITGQALSVTTTFARADAVSFSRAQQAYGHITLLRGEQPE